MPLGLYISVPFCRSKCTYCNFASGVFLGTHFDEYINRLCAEIQRAPETAGQIGGSFERIVDSIYFGGGTPTLLTVTQLRCIFVTIEQNFEVLSSPEVTVECAPGTLSQPMLDELVHCGVNRVSLGVQSFIDQEAASVGRLHNRAIVLDDITRLRAAGVANINVDLIAGLPHQTPETWEQSLDEVIATDVPHASVYMLEVDEDSRLGRELIAGGQKYHAHFVPDEDLTANLYERACERLNATGIEQYEISNFARSEFESKHNLKYWTRQPYLGFGVDAHSMLPARESDAAVRFANPDSLEAYLAGAQRERIVVSREQAVEEIFFLGLRLNRGVDLRRVSEVFGQGLRSAVHPIINDLICGGLLERESEIVRLTPRGRALSNEVFEKFIGVESHLGVA